MKKIIFSALLIGLQSVVSGQVISWATQNTVFPQLSTGVNAMSIVSPQVMWVSGRDGNAAAANYQVFSRTTNGGTNWQSGSINLNNTNLTISDLCATSATEAYVITTLPTGGTGGGIFKTSDSGATWVKQTTASFSSTTSFGNIIHFWDANNGIAMGDPIGSPLKFEIYTTNNGGTNWTAVPVANIPAAIATDEYGYVNQSSVFGDSIWFGTSKGRIFKSNDKGLTWTVVQSPISDFGATATYGRMSMKSATEAILLTKPKSLRKTVDGGATWTTLSPVGTYFGGDISYVPGSNLLLTTGAATGDSGSSYSLNDGLNWTTIEATTQKLNLAAFNMTSVWAGAFSNGSTGGIYKMNSTLGTNEVNLEKQLVNIYPNPSDGIVNIKTEQKINYIQLFDASGKLIQSNTSEQSMDISDKKNGVYILKVQTADGTVFSTPVIKK